MQMLYALAPACSRVVVVTVRLNALPACGARATACSRVVVFTVRLNVVPACGARPHMYCVRRPRASEPGADPRPRGAHSERILRRMQVAGVSFQPGAEYSRFGLDCPDGPRIFRNRLGLPRWAQNLQESAWIAPGGPRRIKSGVFNASAPGRMECWLIECHAEASSFCLDCPDGPRSFRNVF